jgi:hypothetical protein
MLEILCALGINPKKSRVEFSYIGKCISSYKPERGNLMQKKVVPTIKGGRCPGKMRDEKLRLTPAMMIIRYRAQRFFCAAYFRFRGSDLRQRRWQVSESLF